MGFLKFFLLKLLAALISLPVAAQTTDETAPAKVLLKSSQMRNLRGQLCVSMFTTAEGFPADGDKSVFSRCFKFEELNENSEIILTHPNSSSFAVALFHDENGDSQLNTGAFGIPLEGFGFSNNPKIRFSAPKYSECVVQPTDSPHNLSIELRYFL
jgi:uncharacterized protein (DUF2141 family)